MADYLTITELTNEFGLTTRTLRFYEDEGLIKPVRRGRQRLYRPSDRTRLKLILRGKRLGLSLGEISEVIDMYRQPPGEAGQLAMLMEKIDARRKDLRQKLVDIEETIAELDAVEESCRVRLTELGDLKG
ncbi:MerR family transcriptional regulator [Cohaesibacter gelatinilyticus]|uniref:Transcriptional regulator, MerR family n=1 Tax=Cohaesibacter gelatinilyticus TaxID=372072 RepID=A0A285NH33_9HYPH|nr:MerR family DNA-binding transcriptional regulator [Cohaesibacter gelatinilyticus]SNZ08297.1 transcriptional regulator, MerR family [Cohaesibacter gelatinilyticus]HAT84972.1 MerR family DNA-binding transcriptional regulator [Hyphomicrobiales bacterium]